MLETSGDNQEEPRSTPISVPEKRGSSECGKSGKRLKECPDLKSESVANLRAKAKEHSAKLMDGVAKAEAVAEREDIDVE